MAQFDVNTDKMINSTLTIVGVSTELRRIQDRLDSINLNRGITCSASARLNSSLKTLRSKVLDEAVKMHSMGDALQKIADLYEKTENSIIGNGELFSNESDFSATGTDKRKWYQKFWDWVTRKEPDKYDKTTDEQEKAADDAMRKQLLNIIGKEKYSKKAWRNASPDERKKILDDYLKEVYKLYGLDDAHDYIKWDDLYFTDSSATLGQYNHGSHQVTLNNKILEEANGWDSYILFSVINHELRHAYQHEAIDHPTKYMVSQETLDKWQYSFDHRVDSTKDFEGYRNMETEKDARSFEFSNIRV